MKYRANIGNEDDLFHINNFLQAALRGAELGVEDTVEVSITCKINRSKPEPYVSRWTQAPNPYVFRRRTCPICGGCIPVDDSRDGYPEMEEKCPTIGSHYRFAMNMWGTYLRVGGKSFDQDDIKGIDEWLDEVGNERYMK